MARRREKSGLNELPSIKVFFFSPERVCNHPPAEQIRLWGKEKKKKKKSSFSRLTYIRTSFSPFFSFHPTDNFQQQHLQPQHHPFSRPIPHLIESQSYPSGRHSRVVLQMTAKSLSKNNKVGLCLIRLFAFSSRVHALVRLPASRR